MPSYLITRVLFRDETNFSVGAVAEGFVGRSAATAEPFIRPLINSFAGVIQQRKIARNMQRAVGGGFDM